MFDKNPLCPTANKGGGYNGRHAPKDWASLGIISLLHIDATIDITLAPVNSDNIFVTDRDVTDILNNVALVHVGDR